MALDFPSSPTNGQLYTGSDGTTWKWDGAKWVSAGGGGALVSAQQLDLGTRLAAAGTKLNALGPITTVNLQSAASTNAALDTAMNIYSGAASSCEWVLPPTAVGSCLGIYPAAVGAGTSCTIRAQPGEQILAPGTHSYPNASPLIIPPTACGVLATIFLIARPSASAWDILSASPEIHEAMGWVSHPYLAATYAGATVGVTLGAWTKCTMDNVQQDSHGWWDATNKRYTPKRRGKYLAIYESNAGANAGTGPNVVEAAIYLNGAAWATRITSFNGTNFFAYQNFVSCSTIVPCNGSTDYIEPWCWVSGGTSGVITGSSTNQFLVTYLGP